MINDSKAMREWCKHKFGFINFDDTNLYFTSTGNWSDTKDLGELNDGSTKKSSSSERYKSISYLSFLGILVVLILWFAGFKSLGYTAIFGCAWIGYSAYYYFAPGLHREFKIPYSKIKQISTEKSLIEIHFIDFKGEQRIQELTGLTPKSQTLFEEINAKINAAKPPKN